MSTVNANGTGVSTYHLADNPQLYEPSRNNTFEFVVTGIDALLQAGVAESVATEDDWIADLQDVIRLSVATSSVPHFTLDVVTVSRGNSKMHFAGAPQFSEGSLTCNDYVGARTKDVLLAWQALAYDVVDDVVHLAPNYKHDCYLIEYAPDFSYVVRKWLLKGCWINGLSESEFTYDDHDKRQISVNVVFDRAIPEPGDRPGTGWQQQTLTTYRTPRP